MEPDDGSASSKTVQEDNATNYYGPGQPLSTTLGSEYIFRNDRPGVLTLGYVFTNRDLRFSSFFLLLSHGVHFVNDPAAPPGATLLPD